MKLWKRIIISLVCNNCIIKWNGLAAASITTKLLVSRVVGDVINTTKIDSALISMVALHKPRYPETDWLFVMTKHDQLQYNVGNQLHRRLISCSNCTENMKINIVIVNITKINITIIFYSAWIAFAIKCYFQYDFSNAYGWKRRGSDQIRNES